MGSSTHAATGDRTRDAPRDRGPGRGPDRRLHLPRIWTPPLIVGAPGPCGCGCALTPETSYGFDVDDFARDVLDTPLDPWQRWLVIHAGELLPDGRPRFRFVLAIVARQQGKSLLMRVLILFWMFVEQQPMTSRPRRTAATRRKRGATPCEAAKDNPHLAAELPPRPQVLQVGEESSATSTAPSTGSRPPTGAQAAH
jgi:hypothetical protein